MRWRKKKYCQPRPYQPLPPTPRGMVGGVSTDRCASQRLRSVAGVLPDANPPPLLWGMATQLRRTSLSTEEASETPRSLWGLMRVPQATPALQPGSARLCARWPAGGTPGLGCSLRGAAIGCETLQIQGRVSAPWHIPAQLGSPWVTPVHPSRGPWAGRSVSLRLFPPGVSRA